MSRVADKPIEIPSSLKVEFVNNQLVIKNSKESFSLDVKQGIVVELKENFIRLNYSQEQNALAGTLRANIMNIIIGLTQGFQVKLLLVGVGYKAAVQGKKLILNLGYSHPIEHDFDNDIIIEAPSLTEIIIKGSNKQRVGQVAAVIRGYREPEPYKGKGIRYHDEVISLKETKKK